MEAPSPLSLTDCNNQLAIRCIYDTQITPENAPCLKEEAQLACPNEGEGLVGLLDRRRSWVSSF